MEYAERLVLGGAAALRKRPHGSPGLADADYLWSGIFLDRINYVIHREDACAPFLPRTSNVTAEEGVDAAFAFVEAGPAASAFVFAVGGGAGARLAADGTVAACGEGVHREVAEEILHHSTQSAITTYLQEVGARLVVLDNLSCLCVGMEENKGDDWEQVLPWLLTLRRLKIAVLIVHHAGRNGQMRGTSRREDAAFWVLKLEYTENDKSGPGRMAQFVSVFTKERNSGREQVPLEWTFETDSAGVVRITHKQADPLAVFRSWVECGYNTANSIAEVMDTSASTVSKLAKKAQEAGWLAMKSRKYHLVSGAPV